MVSRAVLALESFSTLQDGDWEEGIYPHYPHMKSPQNNSVKIFLLFACDRCIKVCVFSVIIWIFSNKWSNDKMRGKHSFNQHTDPTRKCVLVLVKKYSAQALFHIWKLLTSLNNTTSSVQGFILSKKSCRVYLIIQQFNLPPVVLEFQY